MSVCQGMTRLCQSDEAAVLDAPRVVLDIHHPSRPHDRVRRSREERFGRTLEEVVRDREARMPAFRASPDPLRRTVDRQDFLSGKTPGYADYIVFSAFQWPRAAVDDPVRAWRGRLLGLYGGLARRAPAYGN